MKTTQVEYSQLYHIFIVILFYRGVGLNFASILFD